MDRQNITPSTGRNPVIRSNSAIADIELKVFDDGPRCLDLDLANRLGYPRADSIRVLIKRNKAEIETYGTLHQSDAKSSGGRPGKAFWLNEEQALLVSTLSDAERAPEVRRMVIKVFVAWRRGDLPPAQSPVNVSANERLAVAREGRLQFKMFRSVARDIGLKGNQAVLSANRATKMTTGFDIMGSLGITHIDAEVNQPDIIASEVARRLGLSNAQEANKALVRFGYQQPLRDGKGRLYYELTPKGERAGGIFKDTEKKTGHGVPIKQLMWSSRIVNLLGAELQGEVA